MKHDDEPARLAEQAGLEPWIGRLLRSTGPFTAAPGRKQRVLLGLGRSGRRVRTPLLLRPAVAIAVLVGCGAIASAALGPWRGWIGRTYERLVPRPAPAAAPAVVERAHAHRVAVVTPPVVVPAPAPERTPAPHSSVPTARVRHAVVASLPPAPARAEAGTELVADGMRALRLHHDPAAARALLASYLAQHPAGALAEEALALSIEAAVAHHDSDAPALAARYLQRYPSGPFRALALQAQR